MAMVSLRHPSHGRTAEQATSRYKPFVSDSHKKLKFRCSQHPRQQGTGTALPQVEDLSTVDGLVHQCSRGPRFTFHASDMSPGLPSVNTNAYVQGNHNAPPPPPQAMQSFGQGAPQSYNFQYSNCTGRRKALLIGINYFGQRGQLRGCINDVKNMSTYLNGNFGYAREDMVILTDDQQNPMSQPTKQNILRAMHWLVKDAKPNDSLFFHYSGSHRQARRC